MTIRWFGHQDTQINIDFIMQSLFVRCVVVGIFLFTATDSSISDKNDHDEHNNHPQHPHRKAMSLNHDHKGFIPNLFIVGAQKAGSSSLFELLTAHPLLMKGIHKEPHFFDNDKEYPKGVDYYKSTFFPISKSGGNPKERFIDGTPMLHKEYVWRRIADGLDPYVQLSYLKFIVILREPVARDFSWFSHQLKEQVFLGLPFDDIQTMKEKTTNVFNLGKKNKTMTEDQMELFEKTFRGQYVDQLIAFTKVSGGCG